jgi:hypothetical protein
LLKFGTDKARTSQDIGDGSGRNASGLGDVVDRWAAMIEVPLTSVLHSL